MPKEPKDWDPDATAASFSSDSDADNESSLEPSDSPISSNLSQTTDGSRSISDGGEIVSSGGAIYDDSSRSDARSMPSRSSGDVGASERPEDSIDPSTAVSGKDFSSDAQPNRRDRSSGFEESSVDSDIDPSDLSSEDVDSQDRGLDATHTDDFEASRDDESYPENTMDESSRKEDSDLSSDDVVAAGMGRGGSSSGIVSSDVESQNQSSNRSVRSSTYSRERGNSSGKGAGALAIVLRVVESLLLMVSLVLMFLIAFTPMARSFFFFDIDIPYVDHKYTFGVWGYCTFGWEMPDRCSDRKLGWTFEDVSDITGASRDAITSGFTGSMILHLIAAILLIPAFLSSVLGIIKPNGFTNRKSSSSTSHSDVGTEDSNFSESRGRMDSETEDSNFGSESASEDKRHAKSVYSKSSENSGGSNVIQRLVCLTIFVAIFVIFLLFLIDVIGIPVTGDKLKEKSDGVLVMHIGGAFWAVLVCLILTSTAFILAFIDLTVSGKRNRKGGSSSSRAASSTYETESRGADEPTKSVSTSDASYAEGDSYEDDDTSKDRSR